MGSTTDGGCPGGSAGPLLKKREKWRTPLVMGQNCANESSTPCQAPFEPPEIAEPLSYVVPARNVLTHLYGKQYFVRRLYAHCTPCAARCRSRFVLHCHPTAIHSGMYNKCNYIMFHVEHYVVTICVCTRSGDVSCWPHPWPAIAQDGARPTAPAGISGTRPGFCRRRNRAWRASSRR